MKKQLLLLLVAASVLAVGCQSVEMNGDNTVPQQPFYESGYVPGSVNVKVSEALAEEIGENGTISALNGSKAERLFPNGGQFEERMRREGLHLWYKVSFDADALTLTKAGNTLSSVEGVEYVEFRPKMAITDESSPFNDPDITKQWHYWNRGSSRTGLIAGCDINVLPAWQRGIVGNEKVVVAVIDEGVDYEHEDLHANMWTNPETEPRTTYGYNFDAGSDVITPGDHGTHVAGTISAINNNGIGVNGIAGGDAAKGIKGVRIMSCEIFSSKVQGEGDYEGAITWAANHGAVIAQNSWGLILDYYPDMTETPKSLRVAIDYFNKYAGCDNDGNQLPDSPMKGGVVIFSAGNDGGSRAFPASYEGCIAVASVAGDFTPAYYTNFGDWVDISAPGGDTYKGQEITSTIMDNKYGKMQGTSMACPHVSGVAALIISEFGGKGFTREMCIERLLKTAVPFESDLEMGSGIVNAADALAHFGEYLPNNVKYTGYVSESATSLTLNYVVPDMNNDVRCRKVKVYVSTRKFDKPLAEFYTEDLSFLKTGEAFSVHIDNLKENTEYFVSTVGVDAMGNESAMSANVSASTKGNDPPVIEALDGKEVTMKRFMTKTLRFRISDPDNNLKEVKYTPACGADSFTGADGNYVLTIEGPKAEAGNYTSTITATDECGESAEVTVKFTIEQNQAPTVRNIENQIIIGSQQGVDIDLGSYFTHPDGDELKFTATTPENSVVSVSVQGSARRLSVRSRSFGYSDVTVVATDSFGLSAKCTFMVAAMANTGYEVYPNPVTDGKLYVRSSIEGRFGLNLINSNGATVRTADVANNPFAPYCLDVSGLSAGTYTVNISGVKGDSSYKIAIY